MKSKWIQAATMIAVSVGLNGAAATEMNNAHGTVLIAAPTALNGPTNQGVWFVNPGQGTLSVSLPDLASDQVYEGWLVDDCTGRKISTGLFRATGGIDSDAAGAYAGPLALNFPPVPGSDFVTLGQNLADGGHHVVITIEPYPDSDPNPSGVVVLKADIPQGTMAGTVLNLEAP